jgi:dUTPase
MSTEVLQVKKLSENAFLPVRGTPYAAGFDLSSAYDTVVPARGKVLVKTDLSSTHTQNHKMLSESIQLPLYSYITYV